MSEQTAVGQITLVSVLDGEPGRPGLDGKPGEQGEPGRKGATGKGLDKIVTMYYLSTSSETPSGGQWSRERPEWRINTYLWTYQELHWVNPKEITETDPQLSREWSASREIVRGERNLALKSGEPQTSDVNDDWLAFYELVKPLQKNTTYTVVCSANIKSMSESAKIYLYHNGGSIRINTPMKDLGRGLYSLTIDPLSVSDSNSRIGMKNEPTTAAEPSTVNWFKVVEGEVTAYDWQPAPEDRKAELSQAVVDFNDKMGSLRSEVHSLNSQNEEKIVSMRQDISGIQMRVESKGALYKDLSDKLTSTMETVNIKSYRLNQARLSSLDYELSFRLKGAQSVKLEVVYRWRDSNDYYKDEIVHTKRFGIDSNHYHLISFVLPGLPGERGVLDFNFTNEQNKDFTIQDITTKENYQRGMLDTVSLLSIEQGKITSQVEGVKSSVSDVEGEYSRLSQTVDGITASISSIEGDITRLEVMDKSLTSTITSVKNGLNSSISQTDKRISLLVSGKGEFDSLLKIVEDKISLRASKIDLTGYVTMSDLDGSKGKTIIDGGVIKANSLRAEAIDTGIISANTRRGTNFWNLKTGEFRNISSSGNSISMKDGMISSTEGNFKTEISGGTIKLYDPLTSGDHRNVYEINYNSPRITPFQGEGGGVAYPSSQAGTSGFNLNKTHDFTYVEETKNKIVSFVRKVNIPAFTGQGWTQWITLNFDGYGPDLTAISYAHASSLTAKELIFNIRQVYSYASAITGLQVQGALMTPEKSWPGGEVLIAVLMIGRH